MQLGARLNAIAAFVPAGAKVADIGTDHAYLPVYLVKEKIITAAIAADIAQGPLSAAQQTIAAYGFVGSIETRLGDGLKVLAPGEAETIIIAGMGGSTMTGILARSMDVVMSAGRLILQPMGESAALRQFLYANGWVIKDEALVKEAGRIYQVILAEKSSAGQTALPDSLALEAGPVLLVKRPAIFKEHMQEIVGKYENICHNMEKSSKASKSEKYFNSKKLLEQAKEFLSCL